MTDNDDNIDIEVLELTELAPEEEVVIENEGEKPSIETAEDGIESLREQLERERQARIAAEQQMQEYAKTAYSAQNEVQDSNMHLVNNAIETVRQQQEILKENLKAAMANNDYDAVVEYQSSLSDGSAKLLQLEQGRQALQEAPRVQEPRFQPSDPVEVLASQLTPRSAEWVRRHPEYASGNLYNKMLAAHNLAVADGIAPDSDRYFESVESVLGIASAPQARVSGRAPPAAPVSRSGSGTGGSSNTVTLSAQEREMAEMMGMTAKQYAANKLALKREGKIN